MSQLENTAAQPAENTIVLTPGHRLWVALAELFFLDTEPQERDFDQAAKLLKEAGWSAQKTRDFLIECVAPAAGGNLGFLFWPVIGAWAGFDEKDIIRKIGACAAHRAQHPRWWFFLSDRYCAWMMGRLELDRLLNRLDAE